MLSPVIQQTWLATAILINMLGMGMQLGYTSCLLPGLESSDSSIKLSMETSSWLVSSYGIGQMFGYALASCIMDRLGRRCTFRIELLPAIAGLLLTYFASDVTSLISGRALIGISVGGTVTSGAIIIGEYCSPRHRSMFLNMKTATLCLGSLIVHVLGYFYHWRTVALLNLTPYVIGLLITCIWHESPYWLAQQGRYSESKEVFYRLRGTTEDSVREIEDLIRAQRNERKTFKRTVSVKNYKFFKKFTKRNFLKPVQIFIVAAFLLEVSGRHIFPAYANVIIVKITDNNQHTFYYNVALDVLLTTSAYFSAYLIRIMKLRKLLFSTGLATCISLSLSCTYMYLAANDFIPKGYSAIPMSLFALYLIFVNLGCAPIPLALMGEIFPLEHRAIASSIAGYLISFGLIISLKIMPIMIYTIEIYGAFAVLALCTALALLALYFMLPETKNRTLQEIEDYFKYGRFREIGKEMSEEDVNLEMIVKNDSLNDDK